MRKIGIFGEARQEQSSRRFSGVCQYCEEHQIQVHDFRMSDLSQMDERNNLPPWKNRVDGMIVFVGRGDSFPSDKLYADWILSGGVPTVSMGMDWIDPRIPYISNDHRVIAKLAAQHLHDCGCASFLYYGVTTSITSSIRSQSFSETLKKLGQATKCFEEDALFIGSYEDKTRILAASDLVKIINELPKPLGVWAINDNFASAICTLCEHLQFSIPEQVKILGVNDTSLARLQTPRLTSIRTPCELIGNKAASLLNELIAGRSVQENTIVSACELIKRESTAKISSSIDDVEQVLSMIERYACSGITVQETLEQVQASRTWFHNQFLERVGRTPLQEIQRIRLEKAKSLLKQPQLSITRIAQMIGFEETASFSKFFRKETGMSPRNYRQENTA